MPQDGTLQDGPKTAWTKNRDSFPLTARQTIYNTLHTIYKTLHGFTNSLQELTNRLQTLYKKLKDFTILRMCIYICIYKRMRVC